MMSSPNGTISSNVALNRRKLRKLLFTHYLVVTIQLHWKNNQQNNQQLNNKITKQLNNKITKQLNNKTTKQQKNEEVFKTNHRCIRSIDIHRNLRFPLHQVATRASSI